MRRRMDNIKAIIVAFLSGLTAYLDPIAGNIFSLFWVFFINFFVGYIADIANGGRFEIRKAFWCIVEATIFFVSCASIFVIGRLNGNMKGALQCVSLIVNVIFYFYGCNICRNLLSLLKEGTTGYKVFAFLYYVVSIEWTKKIPYLTNYLNIEHGNKSQENSQEA